MRSSENSSRAQKPRFDFDARRLVSVQQIQDGTRRNPRPPPGVHNRRRPELAAAWIRRGDDRRAAGHRLEIRKPESLVGARRRARPRRAGTATPAPGRQCRCNTSRPRIAGPGGPTNMSSRVGIAPAGQRGNTSSRNRPRLRPSCVPTNTNDGIGALSARYRVRTRACRRRVEYVMDERIVAPRVVG